MEDADAMNASAVDEEVERRYPVVVEGELAERLSRWLWLVKWLLALPHFLILLFLWIAFLLLTVVAFFAILFTERYPRSIFDFNVGVLRWTWRVSFYSYSALATDRYPPFTLGPVPDYPATLDVAYSERLSRGLVLVKWWLLAIPHYIVVSIFGAGWWWGSSWGDPGWGDGRWEGRGWSSWGPDLIGVLVLFAALVLLFANRYPRGIFDFVMGLNRWSYRVVAYARSCETRIRRSGSTRVRQRAGFRGERLTGRASGPLNAMPAKNHGELRRGTGRSSRRRTTSSRVAAQAGTKLTGSSRPSAWKRRLAAG